tara:strand:+ start:142 stop:714 length:573 start_codon:yes stop_codon:yes gene_type:complete
MNYKIGIDVDGVLRDFCDAVTRVVKRDFPHYIKDDFTEIDDWRLANCFNCEKEDLQSIYWHSHAEEIMGNANPMYGSIKKMYDLFEWADKKGHSLSCVTSQKPHARHYTLSWLGKYGLNFDTIYFRRGFEKPDVQVDYLVDDSPNNFNYWIKKRGMQEGFILMDSPYNQHLKSNYRIKDLDEVQKIIENN